MPRLLFQNEIWSKLEKIMLQKRIDNKPNLRLSVEAMYYRICRDGVEVHDCSIAPQLIETLQVADVIIADKGYDNQAIREHIDKRALKSVIPRRSNSVTGNKEMDWRLYKNRHLVVVLSPR